MNEPIANPAETSDVISDAEIEDGKRLGDEAFTKLLEYASLREDDAAYNVTSCALFTVWCNLTQYLAASGWSTDELVKDATHHAELGQSEGRA